MIPLDTAPRLEAGISPPSGGFPLCFLKENIIIFKLIYLRRFPLPGGS